MQFVNSNPIARLSLRIYVVFATLELKFSQPHGRPGVKQQWLAKVEALLR